VKRWSSTTIGVLTLGLAVFGAAFVLGRATAQQATAIPTRIGLIDLDHILKNYQKFQKLVEELNAEVRQKESDIRAMQNELQMLIKQQQAQKPDSPLYAQYQAEATKKRAEIEAAVANAQREFARRQAAIYHSTYSEIEAAVQRYAQSVGLTMVIRSSRPQPVSPNDPQAVFREMARPVVYSHPAHDITDQVLAILNRSAQVTSGTRQPPRLGRPAAQSPRSGYRR